MTRSLVTGGAGFIGSHIVDYLKNQGHDVICVDNESADNNSFYWNDRCFNVKLDITDYQSVKNVMSKCRLCVSPCCRVTSSTCNRESHQCGY